jgi:hypothetical protein
MAVTAEEYGEWDWLGSATWLWKRVVLSSLALLQRCSNTQLGSTSRDFRKFLPAGLQACKSWLTVPGVPPLQGSLVLIPLLSPSDGLRPSLSPPCCSAAQCPPSFLHSWPLVFTGSTSADSTNHRLKIFEQNASVLHTYRLFLLLFPKLYNRETI